MPELISASCTVSSALMWVIDADLEQLLKEICLKRIESCDVCLTLTHVLRVFVYFIDALCCATYTSIWTRNMSLSFIFLTRRWDKFVIDRNLDLQVSCMLIHNWQQFGFDWPWLTLITCLCNDALNDHNWPQSATIQLLFHAYSKHNANLLNSTK